MIELRIIKREVVIVKGRIGTGKTYYAVYKLIHSRKMKKIKNLITNLKLDGFNCIHPKNVSEEDLNVLSQEGYGVLIDDIPIDIEFVEFMRKLLDKATTFYFIVTQEEDIPKTISYYATRIVTPLGKKKVGECLKFRYREEIRTHIGTYIRYVAFPVLDDVFDRILDDHGITRKERKMLRKWEERRIS